MKFPSICLSTNVNLSYSVQCFPKACSLWKLKLLRNGGFRSCSGRRGLRFSFLPHFEQNPFPWDYVELCTFYTKANFYSSRVREESRHVLCVSLLKILHHMREVCSQLYIVRASRYGTAPRYVVAWYAGYKGETAGFKKQLNLLKKDGLVEYPDSSSVRITDAGWKHVTAAAYAPVSNEEFFHGFIREALSCTKYVNAFDKLTNVSSYSKSVFAKEAGYPNETTVRFKKMLGTLKEADIC